MLRNQITKKKRQRPKVTKQEPKAVKSTFFFLLCGGGIEVSTDTPGKQGRFDEAMKKTRGKKSKKVKKKARISSTGHRKTSKAGMRQEQT